MLLIFFPLVKTLAEILTFSVFNHLGAVFCSNLSWTSIPLPCLCFWLIGYHASIMIIFNLVKFYRCLSFFSCLFQVSRKTITNCWIIHKLYQSMASHSHAHNGCKSGMCTSTQDVRIGGQNMMCRNQIIALNECLDWFLLLDGSPLSKLVLTDWWGNVTLSHIFVKILRFLQILRKIIHMHAMNPFFR